MSEFFKGKNGSSEGENKVTFSFVAGFGHLFASHLTAETRVQIPVR
jgi:hypothetical protein